MIKDKIKFRILYLLFILLTSSVSAQNKSKTEIAIGELVPPVSFNKILDSDGNLNSSINGKRFLSDFRGKIVILDFWDIFCGSCISGFEDMSRLQTKFKGEIQVILVNSIQDEKTIQDWIKKQNIKRPSHKIIPENLPILADVKKQLSQLFPIKGEIGYNVWIGQDGRAVLRGISENTHEQKINKLLAGKKIRFVKDNALAYKPEYPFFTKRSDSAISKGPVFSSCLGAFDDDHASVYGVAAEKVIDSSKKTLRNSYINFDIYRLYKNASRFWLSDNTNVVYGDCIFFENMDVGQITTDERLLKRKPIDEDFRNKISYEQIVPLSLPDSLAMDWMFSNLNKYLLLHNGISARWITKEVPCVKILPMSGLKLNTSKHRDPFLNFVLVDGKRMFQYTDYPLSKLFKDYFLMFSNYSHYYLNKIVYNDLSDDQYIDVVLESPFNINSYKDLESALAKVGFKLVPERVKLNVLIINKNIE